MNRRLYTYPAWITHSFLYTGITIAIIVLLEICKMYEAFGFNWADTSIEVILLRFLIISFYQFLYLFTRIAWKENKLFQDHSRTRKLYICIGYLLLLSWVALIISYLDFPVLHNVITYIQFTYIPVSIYLFNLYAKSYIGLMENSRKYYESSVTDSLTKLPNRILFHKYLNRLLFHASNENQVIGIMYLDLDQFKCINDLHGHLAGDDVLREVAERLLACVRSSDTVARLGGDEFTIILPNINKVQDAELVAEKILKSLAEPIQIEGNDFLLTVSIGISVFPFDGQTTETLLRNADFALYHAKKTGKNNYQIYNPL